MLGEMMNSDLLFNLKQTEGELEKAQLRQSLYELEMQEVLKKAGNTGTEVEKYNINRKIQQVDIDLIQQKYSSMKKAYESTLLKSPIDGVVTYVVRQSEGDMVNAFETIIQVSDPSQLLIDWQVSDSSKMMYIRNGIDVQVAMDKKEYKGKVVATPADFVLEEDRKRYGDTVRIKVEGLPFTAEAGDTANISLVIEESKNTIVIPVNALRLEFGKQFVYILDGSSKRERVVEIGIRTPSEVEIINGLEVGQKVIID
ncbi:MAG: HlyD family efflux transporter periplasmic adaptor subunit [Clostridiales bacterium]|nr:HlyD family efflux transporter periplasmic adaptor subunit [Clostridiales bacterium]